MYRLYNFITFRITTDDSIKQISKTFNLLFLNIIGFKVLSPLNDCQKGISLINHPFSLYTDICLSTYSLIFRQVNMDFLTNYPSNLLNSRFQFLLNVEAHSPSPRQTNPNILYILFYCYLFSAKLFYC